jgi:hypothetical protein
MEKRSKKAIRFAGDIPELEGTSDADFEALQMKLIDAIIKHRIYKDDEL